MDNINRRDVLKASAVAASVAALPNIGKVAEDIGKKEVLKVPKKTLKEVLMENQSKFNLTQSITSGQNEVTLAAVSYFVDNLISTSLFGVQPLNTPEGNIYHFSYRTQTGENLDDVNIWNIDGSGMTKEEIHLVIEKLKTKCIKQPRNLEAHLLIRENVDIFAEVLGVSLALEVDRQNVTNVSKNVGTTFVYDFNDAKGDTLGEKFEYLYLQIAEISNVVHRKTLHGGPNWILASADICAIFETAKAGFEPNENLFGNAFKLGIQCVGKINNRWKLYKDPLFKNNEILLGYHGDSTLCNGYMYSPYLMFSDFSQKVITTDSFEQMVPSGENFYAKIKLKNMPF